MSIRQPRWHSAVDLVATALTIATCLTLGSVVLWERLVGPPPPPPKIKVGTILAANADVTYERADVNIVVGLSSKCLYCTESMPALQELNQFVERHRGRVLAFAVGFEPPEILEAYLRENGLSAFRAVTLSRDAPLAVIAATTPQVVAVDRKGTVTESWVGKTGKNQIRELLKRIEGAQSGLYVTVPIIARTGQKVRGG